MITPGVHDSSAAYFQITGITGGTLYQNNGTTPIASGSFITVAQGEAGLKFTPTTGSLSTGSFSVEESTTNAVGGLSGATAAATITVTLKGPTVTGATTTENTQSTLGLVITPGAHDSSATYFQITAITGGTLYQHNGTTVIASGSFITLAQGAAGLKFTPTTGLTNGSFTVQESTTNAVGGLGGTTTTATITVTLAAPAVTDTKTNENMQSTSGLVITPGAHDSSAAFFQITGITGGTLFQHDGTTAIASGSFITLAQGAAGLKFTPNTGSLAGGGFSVQESTTGAASGLSGATATAAITVALAGPVVTTAATTENTQSISGLVITPGLPNDSSAAYFQITNITGGTLFQNNGTTPIANGSFITVAQGEAGLKFTPTTGSLASAAASASENRQRAPRAD